MALVVMIKDPQTGATCGSRDPMERGRWLYGRLDPAEMAGIPADADGAWPRWRDRNIEALLVDTDAAPSGIRWIGWFLSEELAADLFATASAGTPASSA